MVPTEMTLLETASTPVLAALAGAFLGAVMTLLTQLFLRRRRRQRHQRNLRLALGAELSDLGDALEWAAAGGLTQEESNAFVSSLPKTVYEARCGDLGLVTESELTAVIDFYDSLSAAGAISAAEIAHDFDDDFELEYTPEDLLVRHREAVLELWPYVCEDAETLGLQNPTTRVEPRSENESETEDEEKEVDGERGESG